MIAGISFKIYDNFEQYVIKDKDYCDYTKAIDVLNKTLEALVKKNKLTFLYKNKRVKILSLVNETDCGNIFSEKSGDFNYWDDVQIKCEINCEYDDFVWEKFTVGVCPNNFNPIYRFV